MKLVVGILKFQNQVKWGWGLIMSWGIVCGTLDIELVIMFHLDLATTKRREAHTFGSYYGIS